MSEKLCNVEGKGRQGDSDECTYLVAGYASGSGSTIGVTVGALDNDGNKSCTSGVYGLNMANSGFSNDYISAISFGVPSNNSTNCTLKITATKKCTFKYDTGNTNNNEVQLSIGENTFTGIFFRVFGTIKP